MHDPPQLTLPLGHDTTQLPLLHTVPPVHGFPQVPQLLGSLPRLMQTLLQLVCPVGQQMVPDSDSPLGQPQLPDWQVVPPLQVAPWLLPAVLLQSPLAPQ
jgi:hypothetical protein